MTVYMKSSMSLVRVVYLGQSSIHLCKTGSTLSGNGFIKQGAARSSAMGEAAFQKGASWKKLGVF